MKRIFLIVFFAAITLLVNGQAKPSYTQYILNNYILNPAVAGIENYTDVKLSYRNQWTGIEGAPVTAYFSIHAPIGKSDLRTSATSMPVRGVNPRGKDYWDQYSAPAPHHGIGAVVLNDRAGYLDRWSIYATYAYHKPLSNRTTLSAGINLGISSVSLDRSKIDFASTDPNDPAIGYANNELKKIKPEIAAGLWLYSDKYFAGLSVLNIIPAKQSFVKNNRYGETFTPNYFLTTGYRILVGNDWNLIPSVMFQYWQPQLSGLHVNAKLMYTDLLWIGGSYRYSNLVGGYSAMLGLNIANINVSYAYEVATTNRLRTYTGNTHEIMIGFLLGNKYGDSCPKNIW
ncbi:MAG: type IX secretion system membrane protein PorP/SprF [Bacteroidetes bacterium]|nr:type IX secretion system membrane protein PorP/SprF [Bacteroidota bacterium]